MALQFELRWEPTGGTATLLLWGACSALGAVGLAAFTDWPLLPEIPEWRHAGPVPFDENEPWPSAGVTPSNDVPLHRNPMRLAETEGPARSTVAGAICLGLVSAGLLIAGAAWCLVAARLLTAPGDPFWWVLDAIVSTLAGGVVLAIGLAVAAAAIVGFSAAHGLLQRTSRARSRAMHVFLFALLLFFATSYLSPAASVAGMITCLVGAALLLLPSTTDDFRPPRPLDI